MPSRLGRYVVRRRIGSGGFATVWLAYDEQLDAPVAVKVLADNWTEDLGVRNRFVEEGRYLRRVESPHVVTVYDAGELEDGRPYLVMAYADQGTLADRLEVGPLTPAQALEVVRQVGSGLQALHDRDVAHRDVKPANVLFRTSDRPDDPGGVRVMLGDLGLGKSLDVSSRLTMIAGTPSYVAPEQAQGESLDGRADQYSLGVLTFLLLSGRTPWTHAHLSAAAEPPPPPSLSTPEQAFPPAVEDVVRRSLAREREDRWPTVTDYVEALTAALAGLDRTTGDAVVAVATAGPGLQVDPERTRPGARPSPAPVPPPAPSGASPDPEPTAPRRPARARRAPVLVAAVLALAVGAGGGWLGVRALAATTTVADDRGELSVDVPSGWDVVSGDPWTPPDQDSTFAALSAGTSAGWRTDDGQAGVFVGLLPLEELPTRLPEHPGCDTTEDPVADERDGQPTSTVWSTGCPGVVVERVVQVADNRVLWVQVRSPDRSAAAEVLDSVDAAGLD